MGLSDMTQVAGSPASPLHRLFTSESQRRIDTGELETMTPVARHSIAH